jgi:hypothetical protein
LVKTRNPSHPLLTQIVPDKSLKTQRADPWVIFFLSSKVLRFYPE